MIVIAFVSPILRRIARVTLSVIPRPDNVAE
jgi:hypothetical protein